MLCSVFLILNSLLAGHEYFILYILEAVNDVLSPPYSSQVGLCRTGLSGHGLIWLRWGLKWHVVILCNIVKNPTCQNDVTHLFRCKSGYFLVHAIFSFWVHVHF